MDTRVGYPNEHLAGDSDSETTSPLYATAVGLVMNSLESKARANRIAKPEDGGPTGDGPAPGDEIKKPPKPKIPKKSFLDDLTDRLKDFLDNAE